MAKPLDISLPQDCQLSSGYTVSFEALDPTDGATVTGVVISDAVIFGTPLGTGSLAAGPFQVVNPVLIKQAQA